MGWSSHCGPKWPNKSFFDWGGHNAKPNLLTVHMQVNRGSESLPLFTCKVNSNCGLVEGGYMLLSPCRGGSAGGVEGAGGEKGVQWWL